MIASTMAPVFAGLIAVAVLAACQRTQTTQGLEGLDAAGAPALESFQVRDGDSNLVFQYPEPGAGELKVARKVADIPESARGNVFVTSTAFCKGDVPANLVIVANLSKPDDDGTYPFRLVSRYDRVRPAGPTAGSGSGAGVGAPGPAAGSSADSKVILFSTSWCPHCRSARQWLEANKVPFEEKNVESDSAAQRLLAELGRKQGLPDNMLSSVPILYVKGQLILGFNQSELARLLGK